MLARIFLLSWTRASRIETSRLSRRDCSWSTTMKTVSRGAGDGAGWAGLESCSAGFAALRGVIVCFMRADKASVWFKKSCYSRSEGEHRDKCACFYWAFRAHTTVNATEAAGLAIDIAVVLPFTKRRPSSTLLRACCNENSQPQRASSALVADFGWAGAGAQGC